MLDKLVELSAVYQSTEVMDAMALTGHPEIGRVSENLRLVSVPVPRPLRGQVAIKLSASSMHVDEIYAAQGTALGRFFGPKSISNDEPYVMGTSVSGTIVAIGPDVSRFHIGDEVIVIPNELGGDHGAWAAYICASQDYVLGKPESLTHVEAAAITLAACVAWGAVQRAQVKPGDQCLVVGASGAVGAVMVQYLKSKKAIVTGVCSSANTDFVSGVGADAIIDYRSTAFLKLKRNSFDRVFDLVGGREIETATCRGLKRSGKFITAVGPVRYIGERKLSRFEFGCGLGYILWRSLSSRLLGARYMFSASFPKHTALAALLNAERHNIRCPAEMEIPFCLSRVQSAIKILAAHRAKGRIVINFELARLPV